jgi:hypothetical protein
MKMCIAEKPDFLFLSPGVLDELSQYTSLEDWKTCDIFDFRNVHSVDSHHLLVPSANLEGLQKSHRRNLEMTCAQRFAELAPTHY